jgi:Zn2+/Cd2+-exporting ATPase
MEFNPLLAQPLARLTYAVQGMDCPTCVMTIESATRALSGVKDLHANYLTQTLDVALDETATPRSELEARLRSLGHPATVAHSARRSSHEPGAPPAWYRTRAGQHALAVAALITLAFALAFTAPQAAPVLYATATALGVAPLVRKAVASARAGTPFSINTLVSLAAVGALLIGEYAEGAVVVLFFLVGEMLEGVAAGRARHGIRALAALTPTTATLIEHGRAREVDASELAVGQRVRVAPGSRVPADGTILSGASHLDESPVTGESIPRFKDVGDSVYASSINHDGVLELGVTRAASDNTLARILELVERAEASRSPTARFIDRFSRGYTPFVLLAAVLTMLLPPLLAGADWATWTYRGLALLLIGCPCALVLSVPAAITSAIAAGARRGLLVKGGAVLETLAQVSTVAFDKTGTLTEGRPVVTDIHAFVGTERDVLAFAAAVEATSKHPLAQAITTHAQRAGIALPDATEGRALPGRAVEGTVNGSRVIVASPRHALEMGALADEQHLVRQLEDEGKTAVVVLIDGAPAGVIALRDNLRNDARAATRALARLGVGSVMLTGDNARTAHALAAELGIPSHPELLPEDKHRLIEAFQGQGPVAMVGDGINDAPALARADVGIAMGGGTDVALETAHAALLRPSVLAVADLLRLARATMNNVRINIAVALGLKAIFLVTTLMGVTGLWAAILADTGATALVTMNALRLLGFRSDA